MSHWLAPDHGTGNSRRIAADAQGQALARARSVKSSRSRAGSSPTRRISAPPSSPARANAREALARAGLGAARTALIGITNPRETDHLSASPGGPPSPGGHAARRRPHRTPDRHDPGPRASALRHDRVECAGQGSLSSRVRIGVDHGRVDALARDPGLRAVPLATLRCDCLHLFNIRYWAPGSQCCRPSRRGRNARRWPSCTLSVQQQVE